MKVVILCGGLGTRLREETEYRPKPMVPIGGRPILWHIMKLYAYYGHKDFILCLGYKGDVIKDYFRNYHSNTSDVTLRLGRTPQVTYHSQHDEEDWTVTLLETGLLTQTGGRLRRALPFIDFVFHLAAQALVRRSYQIPIATLEINVIGTMNLLEALRLLEKPCAAVFVTSDKCYDNREWVYGYRENDPLGGSDPYSSSKACAELLIASWRKSFFSGHPVKIASARAGNVIGGGDWSQDRIVVDCIKALQRGESIPVRNKTATRPWQHVLEPLSGYLWLAAKLAEAVSMSCLFETPLASAFNFGPTPESNRTVLDLVKEILIHWPGTWEDKSDPKAVHEAHLLQLSIDKAKALLGWSPVIGFSEAVRGTVQWYQAACNGSDMTEFTADQILMYCEAARRKSLPWATP